MLAVLLTGEDHSEHASTGGESQGCGVRSVSGTLKEGSVCASAAVRVAGVGCDGYCADQTHATQARTQKSAPVATGLGATRPCLEGTTTVFMI